MHLVMDISDVGTDDVLDWAGCSTSRTIYCEIDHLHEHFPHDWLRFLKNSDHYNEEKPAIFHINLIGSHAFFHCSKTKHFIIITIKQIDIIVQQRFGKKFKLIPNIIIYGIKSKVVNYASNFLWSKLIRVIWITRRLLAERKP